MLLLSFFLIAGLFFAFRVGAGVMPDEEGHLLFSQTYSTTFGIPQDTPKTMVSGWAIAYNPFIYYWINGRVINLVQGLNPDVIPDGIRLTLRLLNLAYSSVTLWIAYLLSRELFLEEWWHLLPPFLLSQVMMFSFLSAGISYDNLANLFATIGLLFFVRFFTREQGTRNLALSAVFLGLGCLTKVTIVPLAGLVVLAYFGLQIWRSRHYQVNRIKNQPSWFLTVVLVLVMTANIYLYAGNLLRFQGLTPECREVFAAQFCHITPFAERARISALPEKLTISESIRQGYPNPVTYFFLSWVPDMIHRIHGILAHLSHFPHLVVKVLYGLMFVYLLFGFPTWSAIPKIELALLFIFTAYALLVFYTNYQDELLYGFKQIGMHGRYLFPVILIAYLLMTRILINLSDRKIKYAILGLTLITFILSGPIFFLINRNTIFMEWLIH